MVSKEYQRREAPRGKGAVMGEFDFEKLDREVDEKYVLLYEQMARIL